MGWIDIETTCHPEVEPLAASRARVSQFRVDGCLVDACVPPQSCPRRSQDAAFGCAHSPYCGRWARRRRVANGVDGRRRRRRGTPFVSAKTCRDFADLSHGHVEQVLNKSLRERHPWLRGSGVECRLEEAKRKGSVRGVSRMRCEGRMSSKRKAKRNNAYNAR